MKVTGKDIIDLAEHAKKIGTIDAWVGVAKQWIEGAEEHIHLAFHPELGWAVDPKLYEQAMNTNADLEKKIARMQPIYDILVSLDDKLITYKPLADAIKKAREDVE